VLYFWALILPSLAMLLCGKPFQALLCLVLQLTVLGWLPATIWAWFVVSSHLADKRTDRLVQELRKR
jgi:uncharacterized membrane protein YqaE (UPF0057 family)